MKLALDQARIAYAEGEVPVGAVVVCDNKVIGKGYNQTERLKDPTAHAEIIAITAACRHLGSKYLDKCTMYVTLEPCCMCGGALYWSQLGRLIFSVNDKKRGCLKLNVIHPKTIIEEGYLQRESSILLKSFFKTLRMRS